MTFSLKDDVTREYLKKCVRCGQCRSVCPVLAETGWESASPRGKVYLAGLIQKGEVSPGPRAESILSLCLTCGACTAECPSGLPVDRIITAARAAAAGARPYSPLRLACRQFFSERPRLEKIPGFTALGQALARRAGLAATRAARSKIPALARPENKKPRLKVGYFLGCASNYLLPEAAVSAVEVLRHLGCQVVTPPSYCCGLPLEAAGDPDPARRLLDKNHRLFQGLGLDAVVTDCSSCSHYLTEKGFGLNSGPVYEFTEFLFTVLNPPPPVGEPGGGGAVTCHDPCHLRYGRKMTGPLRQVMGLIPGIKMVETPGGGSCCGGGGTFFLRHRELSAGILARNTGGIMSSGARRVVTVCPSCALQIGRGLKSSGIEVSHPALMLAAAYGLTG